MATTTRLSMLGVQMPKALADSIRRLAEEHEHSVQHEIRCALRNHVERETREPVTRPPQTP